MAEASGKSGSPPISSIAAPTADIDDEWALDDAEPAAAPLAKSPSGQAALDAQKSAAPVTEAIDSEWPDDAVKADQSADQLRKPKIPLAPKLPEEAAGFQNRQSSPPATASAAATPSEPPVSERSIDEFERAAASTGRGAFGIRSSAPPAPASTAPHASAVPASAAPASATSSSTPSAAGSGSARPPTAPPESGRPAPPEAETAVAPALRAVEVRTAAEAAVTPEVATSTAPVTRAPSARPTSSAAPPASEAPEAKESEPPAGKSRKGAIVGYGLAAAIAIAGLGLGLINRSAPDRAIERAQGALEPDSARKANPAQERPAVAPLPHAEAPRVKQPSAAAPVTSAGAEIGAETHGADDKGSADKGAESEGATDAEASPEAATSAEAPEGGAPILATVHIYPPEAEIYHKGKRLGRSGQQIEVLPGERKLLVLIRDGYWPRKLILDGKETTYNIGLRKMPEGATGGSTTASAAPKFTPPAP